MNKNNFFVKFAHFYFINLKEIKHAAIEIWDAITRDFLLALVKTILGTTSLILYLIFCFLPIPAIIWTFCAKYLTPDEVKRLKDGSKHTVYYGGYFRKKEIKEFENELLRKQEMEANNDAIP